MQDEPGGRGCFACKMSLERGSAMLGIDDQSEQQTGNEPGRDPGFFESQRSRAFRWREKGGGLRLGERVPGGAELGRVGAYGARFAAAIYGADDGAEPRTDHASDHPIRGGWRDRKSTRLNSSHLVISYAVFCLKKKKKFHQQPSPVARAIDFHYSVP